MAESVLDILRKHLLPYCSATDDDLPSQQYLAVWLTKSLIWDEWTIDAFGARDWKIDCNRGLFSIRYKGEDPEARAAADACNEELRSKQP